MLQRSSRQRQRSPGGAPGAPTCLRSKGRPQKPQRRLLDLVGRVHSCSAETAFLHTPDTAECAAAGAAAAAVKSSHEKLRTAPVWGSKISCQPPELTVSSARASESTGAAAGSSSETKVRQRSSASFLRVTCCGPFCSAAAATVPSKPSLPRRA